MAMQNESYKAKFHNIWIVIMFMIQCLTVSVSITLHYARYRLCNSEKFPSGSASDGI